MIQKDWIALSKALVASEMFECQILAFEMIGRNKKLLNERQDMIQKALSWALRELS